MSMALDLEGLPSLEKVAVALFEPYEAKAKQIVPAGDLFDLPSEMAAAWYASSQDLFLLECSPHAQALVEISPFGGEDSGLAFEKVGLLEDGRLIVRAPLLATRIAVRASKHLSGCSVALLSTNLSASEWLRSLEQQDADSRGTQDGNPFSLEALERLSSSKWTSRLLPLDDPQTRRSAAILNAPLTASALDIRRLLKEHPFCESRPHWRAAQLQNFDETMVDAGFAELLFWPDSAERTGHSPLCFDLLVDGLPAPRRCVKALPALDRQARILDPDARLLSDDGRAIGRPIRIRLGLDRTRRLSLRPVGMGGWISLRWFSPKRSWRNKAFVPPRLMVAWPQSEFEDQEIAWQFLTPTQGDLPSHSRLVLLPLSPLGRVQAIAAGKDEELSLWRPSGQLSPIPQPDNRGWHRLDLLLERRGQPGTPCALTLAGQTFATSMLDELVSSTVLMPQAVPVPISVEGHCAVWNRTSWKELPANMEPTARTLLRFYSIGPGRSVSVDLPGPPVEGLFSLRAFMDEDVDGADGARLLLQVENRSSELVLFGQGPERVVRYPVRLHSSDRKATVTNHGEVPVWMAFAIRAPMKSSPDSSAVGPVATLSGEAGLEPDLGEVVALRRAVGAREPDSRNLSELLELSRRLNALAEVALARDVLALAARAAKTSNDIDAVRREEQEQRGSAGSLWAALEAGLLSPLPRGMLAVAKPSSVLSAFHGPFASPGMADYEAALSMRGRYLEDPSSLGGDELLFVHTVATREEDYLLAAWAVQALRERGENLSTDLQFLREIVWAAQDGQYVPDEWRVVGAVLATRLVERIGPQLEPLRRVLLSLTTLEETQAFFGIDRTVLLSSDPAALDDPTALLRYGEHWDQNSSLELRAGDKRLLELTLTNAVEARLEVQWAVRLDEDGTPPRCHVVLRAADHAPLTIPAATDPLDAISRHSEALRLSSGATPLLVELACDDLRAQARARFRIWLSRRLPGISSSGHKSFGGMSELLLLRNSRRYLQLNKNKVATIDVLGPTTLRITALSAGPTGQTSARLRCVSPRGQSDVVDIVDSETPTSSVEVVLDGTGTHTCQLEAFRQLVFIGAYRRPDETASALRRQLHLEEPWVSPERALIEQLQPGGLSPARLLGRPQEVTGPGTLWAGWMAAEDSVVRESDEPRPWVNGPLVGWHSQAIADVLWWKVDTQLRLRPQGSPAGLAQASAAWLPGWNLAIKSRIGAAWQEIESAGGWSLRGNLEIERELALGRFWRVVPFCGIRGAWSRVQAVEGAGAAKVDSALYSPYLANHAAALYPGATVKLRPIDPLLLQGELRYVTNESLNPADPERLDLDFDAFAGFDAGLVARLSLGLSTRFEDRDRTSSTAFLSLGGGLSYLHWLSPKAALVARASGTYVFVLNNYDAMIFVGLLYSFGGGLSDEHPSWTPLPSYLESRRPREAVLSPR
jgi:hypothetical protein